MTQNTPQKYLAVMACHIFHIGMASKNAENTSGSVEWYVSFFTQHERGTPNYLSSSYTVKLSGHCNAIIDFYI